MRGEDTLDDGNFLCNENNILKANDVPYFEKAKAIGVFSLIFSMVYLFFSRFKI